MMAVTTEDIKKLREATSAGILDCRNALEASGGDFDKAVDFLREKGLAAASKRADREASEGIVEIYSHGGGRVGVMVEINCETDFVGRSEEFRTFAHEVALQIAASSPIYIKEADIPAEVLEHEQKIAEARAREEGKPENILPKIIEGSIKKFKDESVLLRQPYIRDESVTIEQMLNQRIGAMGENIVIRRFARYALGEESVSRGQLSEMLGPKLLGDRSICQKAWCESALIQRRLRTKWLLGVFAWPKLLHNELDGKAILRGIVWLWVVTFSPNDRAV